MSVSYSESSVTSYKAQFEEKRSLDRGAFSTVFEALSHIDKRLYAVKKIPFQLKDHKKTLREVDILLKLSQNSKYIIKYIESWIETNYYIDTGILDYNGNLLFDPNNKQLLHIQMELYPMNLQAVIKKLKSPEKNYLSADHYGVSCRLLVQILEGVQELHDNVPDPIIHRDLKPENIMIAKEISGFCIKIGDFGLSTYDDFINKSKTKYIGTVSYKAPDVDIDGHYSTKVDVYSIGRILEQLFNINVNQPISIKLEPDICDKYKNLLNRVCECLHVISEQRPTCKDFLLQREFWSHTISDEKFNTEIENIIENQAQNVGNYEILSKKITNSNEIQMTTPFTTAGNLNLWSEFENSKLKISLLWAAFQEMGKNPNLQNSIIDHKFKNLFEEYFADFDKNRDCIDIYRLADCYRSLFDTTIHGKIFIQNYRFKNEFMLEENLENSLVGKGSYGEVFKAQHKYDEQVYAIKKQKIDLTSDTKVNERIIDKFLKELKVNAVIKYDFLLTYKSFWFESDNSILNLYIQMELCAMDLKRVSTLSNSVTPNIMHLFVISQLFEEIVEVVGYLHSRDTPIIHRDLKPANILLTCGENGRFIKIADFGFAVFHDTPQMTHTSRVGTAEYTAPEVKSGQYDTKADVFSLGMVLAKISNFFFQKEELDLFDTKLKALTDLKTTLIDHVANNRPNCAQILANKSWLLTEIEIRNKQEFKAIIDNSHNVYNIYKSFFEYFTYVKIGSRNVNNDVTFLQKLFSGKWIKNNET